MEITFHELYERYAGDVRRFAQFLCGDPSLADDITQETFVRAWTSFGSIRQATVKSYLFTIARNLYRDSLRRPAAREPLAGDVPDGAVPVQARLERADELRRVLAAIGGLPPADRDALLLHVRDELPHGEIAKRLGLSVAAVKVRIYRARLKLARVR
jgi:RNA polymerase sigma-70 factor, ECF subfamily